MNNLKICVCMWYDDNIKQYADINLKINQLYCKKYNYDLIYSNKRMLPSKPQSWEKLPFLEEILKNKKYDYVVWIDADAFFYIDSPPIENVIKKHPDENFIFSQDMYIFSYNLPSINCGIFIVKNTDYCNTFLKKWYTEEYEVICPTWWEQNNIIQMYKQNILDIQNKCLIIDFNILQHFSIDDLELCTVKKYGLQDKPFVRHVPNKSTDFRTHVSNQYLLNINKLK